MLEGKIGEAPFLKVQSGKITMWVSYFKIQIVVTKNPINDKQMREKGKNSRKEKIRKAWIEEWMK